MPSVDLSLRYPVARTTYVRETGAIRQESIAKVFKEVFPFAEVTSGHVNANGTDITITCYGHTYKAEVFNEDEMSYIDAKRAYGTVRNLQNCDASMFFCNFGNFGSENAEKTLANTPTLRIGWQELKREHHAFYRKKDEVYKRRVSNEKSHQELKRQILSFLISINFPLLMYIISNTNYIISKSRPLNARINPKMPERFLELAPLDIRNRLKSDIFDNKFARKANSLYSLSEHYDRDYNNN